MFEVLVQMAGLILCGVGWRLFKPAGLEPAPTRKVLTSLVYYLLLPALVLSVLWKAELGGTTLLIAASAAFATLAGLLLSMLVCRSCRATPAVTGAVILAAAFPNVTYLGLPVLEATFGPWARSVAIQYDLFACTPLLFTVGALIGARYGVSPSGSSGESESGRGILTAPSGAAGRVMVTRVPSPTWLATSSFPPCSATTQVQSESPNPVP